MDRLRVFVDQIFASVPESEKGAELKQEMLLDLQDKYQDLLASGHSAENAYNIVVAGVGDLSTLLDELRREQPNYTGFDAAAAYGGKKSTGKKNTGSPPPPKQAPPPGQAPPPPQNSAPQYQQRRRNNTALIIAIVIIAIVVVLPCAAMFAFCGFAGHVLDNVDADSGNGLGSFIGNMTSGIIRQIDIHGMGTFNYPDSSRYHVAEGTVEIDAVRDLEINWVSGDIHVESYDGDMIRFSEDIRGGNASSSERMHYYLNGDKLSIQYCAANFGIRIGGKDLTLLIPESSMPERLTIDSVSSKTEIKGVSVERLTVNSVSGDTLISDCEAAQLRLDSVSGNTRSFFRQTPMVCNISSISGDTYLYLPEDSGFTARLDSVSGKMRSDFEGIWDKDSITCNGGGGELTFDSVSGNVSINKQ